MIIGLTGKKMHGKDTAGAILVAEHGYKRLSYADALKRSAAALFDVPIGWWEEHKNHPAAYVELTVNGRIRTALSVRQFLQRYGTEAHREVFGDNFWTNVVDRAIEEERKRKTTRLTKVVVTDVRFDNEASIIRRHGGIVVEVYRPQVEDDRDGHASEQTPEADMMLWNGEDIEALRQRIAQYERDGWDQAIV